MKWINFTVVFFFDIFHFQSLKIFFGKYEKKNLFCEIVLTHLANDHNWVKIIGTFAANMFFFLNIKKSVHKKNYVKHFPKEKLLSSLSFLLCTTFVVQLHKYNGKKSWMEQSANTFWKHCTKKKKSLMCWFSNVC